MHKTFTRLTGCLLLVLFLGFSLSAFAQEGGSKIALSDALKTIQTRFKTQFAYEHGLLTDKFTTQKDLQGKTVEDVLKNVLYPNNLIFLYVSENTYSIVARNSSFFTGMKPAATVTTITVKTGAAPRTIRGTITNEVGQPLAFVSVWVKGTNQATRSNDDGGFLLPVVSPGNVLVFSMVGYNSQEIIAGDETKLAITLQPNKTMLNEVNVVSNGYQQTSKERSTGSTTVITSKDLEGHPQSSLLQRLEGLVPGVQINVLSGDRGFFYQSGSSIATTQVGLSSGTRTVGVNDYSANIRGRSTLTGESSPLIVLDGAITEMDLSTLNPNDVDNITFLKDAAAASIWGVRAANGVIVVTTKKGKHTQKPDINFSSSFTFGEKPDISYYKTMNSAQQLNYEKELVNRNWLPAIAGSDYYSATYLVSPGTYLAQQLKAGTITQSQYNAQASAMGAIDNRSQISKYFFQGAQSQQYNFSVGGGTDYSTYYYAASYSQERPTEVRNYGKRLTATLNNSWKLFNWATLSTSFKGSFLNLVNDGMNLYSLYAPSRTTLLPYEQIADANGNGIAYDRLLNPSYTQTLPSTYKNWQYNYLNELANNDNTENDNNYSFNVNLKVPIYKGLSASAIYNTERTFSAIRTYYSPDTYYMRNMVNYYTYPTTTTNSLGITNGGGLQQVNTNQNNYSLRTQLDYNYTFGKHEITALAGTEIRETNAGQNTFSLWGYNPQTGYTNNSINFSYTPTYSYIAASSPTQYTTFQYGGYPTETDKKRRFLSYFGNAAYTFNSKYTVSGSVRYDDYNNFGLDRKYRATPLWSTGLKWNASREDFLKDVKWLDQLAVRASYGVNGNLSLSTYPYTWISLGSSDVTTGQTYASLIAPANPQLRWEKTYVKNFGVDFGLFGNRLNGTVDVYYKNSKDLLYSFPTSAVYLGTTSTLITRNAASMKNRGVDVGLNGVIVRKGDWTLGAGATFSYNTNQVTDSYFKESLYANYYGYYPPGISYITGYATDKLLVYRNAGLDANGLTQIYDHNGNIVKATTTTLTSLADLKYAGRTNAPIYGGFNANLRYKQFSLFTQATYQFGSVFLKPSVQNYITSIYSQTNYDLSADIAKRWQNPGDEASTVVPGLNGTAQAVNYSLYRYQYSDINVLKGDYIRLRQVTFSYQLPSAWLSKYKIKGAQVGATANNLGLLWTANKQGYDPDFAGYVGGVRGLPAARSYTLNINLSF